MAMLDVVEACAGGGSGVGCVTVFVAAALLVAGCSQVPVESVDEPVAEEPGVERDEQPEPDPPPEEPSSESEGEAEPALGDPEELEDESASPDEVRAQEVEIPPVEIPPVEQLGFTWDVRDGVAKEELEFIEIGIALGVGYSEAFYGGAIPHDDRSQFTVMVVADGAGDALIGGGGFCCSWKPESSTVFFDVGHPEWTVQGDWFKIKIAAHEYGHAWLGAIGCTGQRDKVFWLWLDEGIAEHLAYHAVVGEGYLNEADPPRLTLRFGLESDSLDYPLSAYDGSGQPPRWPGDIGFLAVEMLIDGVPDGPLALRDLCSTVAAGTSVSDAIQHVFGISSADLHSEFEAWRTEVVSAQ